MGKNLGEVGVIGLGEGMSEGRRQSVGDSGILTLGTDNGATRPEVIWRQEGVKIGPDDTFHHYTVVEVATVPPPGYLGHQAVPRWRALVKQCAISTPVSETPASPLDTLM